MQALRAELLSEFEARAVARSGSMGSEWARVRADVAHENRHGVVFAQLTLGMLTKLRIYNIHVHPGKLTWNLTTTGLYREQMVFQRSIFRVHVNFPGCIM